jgi:hypothetical protein
MRPVQSFLLCLALAGFARAADQDRTPTTLPALLVDNILYVPGSTQKICQITGENDRQTHLPTPSRTDSRFGLMGSEYGYSFEHDGKIFFLFGNSAPYPKFHGQANGQTDPPRNKDDKDAIGFIPIAADIDIEQGLRLDFIRNDIGAYQNPVVLNDRGEPAIRLAYNEFPIAGISVGGRMYVIFGTDNPYANPPPGQEKNLDSGPTRSIVAVSDDDAKTFHYLYDFSKGPDAKFIFVAIVAGPDGYLYFWGTQGGLKYRMGAPYFARKKASLMDRAEGMEYFTGLGMDGQPRFSSSESDASPIFAEGSPQSFPGSGVGELGVEWNRFVKRWVVLYQTTNIYIKDNLPGIHMRLADDPWGPWTAPQTIFNCDRDGGLGHFLHRAVTADQRSDDGLSTPERIAQKGGPYAPYLISHFTTGDEAAGRSTFYYTMSTWNPYTQVIMKSTIQASR